MTVVSRKAQQLSQGLRCTSTVLSSVCSWHSALTAISCQCPDYSGEDSQAQRDYSVPKGSTASQWCSQNSNPGMRFACCLLGVLLFICWH